MSSRVGQRYLNVRSFLDYCKWLMPREWVREDLLEFLDREGMLMPVRQVRFPDPVFRGYWRALHNNQQYDQSGLDVEAKEEVLRAVDQLLHGVNWWGDPELSPLDQHPLDAPRAEWKPYIIEKPSRTTFKQWKDLSVEVANMPTFMLKDSSMKDYQYYHAWQAFHLAELMRTGIQTIYDFRDKDLARLAWAGQENLPRERRLTWWNERGIHGSAELLKYVRAFDAVSYYSAHRQRVISKLFRTPSMWAQRGISHYLTDTGVQHLSTEEVTLSHAALQRFNVTVKSLCDFTRWQFDKWEEFKREEHGRLADEYRQHMALTVNLYRASTQRSFENAREDIGKTYRDTKYVLDVAFPDPQEEAREGAMLLMKTWLLPDLTADLASSVTVTQQDVEGYVSWLVSTNQYHLLEAYGSLLVKPQETREMQMSRVIKEVYATSALVEHSVNTQLQGTAQSGLRKDGLSSKVRVLLRTKQTNLEHELSLNMVLVQFKDGDGIQQKLQAIDTAVSDQVASQVAGVVLRMLLLRNAAVHHGLDRTSMQPDEVAHLLRTLLKGSFIVWKLVQ